MLVYERWLDRQPTGFASIARTNPLTRGLIHAVMGTGYDLAGFSPYVGGFAAISPPTRAITRDGVALAAASTNNSGYDVAQNGIGTTQAEISSFGIYEIDSWDAYSGLWTIPYSSASWASPYGSIGLQRNLSNNNVRLWGTRSTDQAAMSFVATSLTVSTGRYEIGVARNSAGAWFNVNGAVQNVASASADLFYNPNRQPLTILNRQRTSVGEGVTGRCAVLYLWNRALSPAELESVRRNPWQLLCEEMRVAFVGAAAAVPSITAVYADSVGTDRATPRVTLDYA